MANAAAKEIKVEIFTPVFSTNQEQTQKSKVMGRRHQLNFLADDAAPGTQIIVFDLGGMLYRIYLVYNKKPTITVTNLKLFHPKAPDAPKTDLLEGAGDALDITKNDLLLKPFSSEAISSGLFGPHTLELSGNLVVAADIDVFFETLDPS